MSNFSSITRKCAGRDVVALVPAAGSGSRIAPIPVSKEVFPIGFADVDSDNPKIRVISQYLFERLAAGGVGRGIVVLREGKWDIPAFFGEGQPAGMNLSYVVVGKTLGPPDTLDRARPFVQDNVVAFGFPDIMLGPPDVYDQLLSRMDAGDVDAVLGLYDVVDPRESDMVELDDNNRVIGMQLKDPSSTIPCSWACAVWGPRLTEFMHTVVQEYQDRTAESFAAIDAGGDLPMGLVFKRAVESGLAVAGVRFNGEHWTDLGTPRDMFSAAANLHRP